MQQLCAELACTDRMQGLRVFASAAAPEPSKAERQVWFPGNKAPDYLDGSLPGDFGFDPLGLGSDPETLRWCAARAALVATNHEYLGICCCCSRSINSAESSLPGRRK